MKKTDCIFFTLFVLFYFFLTCNNAIAENAIEILKKVNDRYTNLTTYQDSGSVITDIGEIEFETLYRNPGYFLFKWTRKINVIIPENSEKIVISNSSALWCMGNSAFIHFHYKGTLSPKIKEYRTLEEAIYVATGNSWASSLRIPKFFFPNLNSLKFSNLIDPKLINTIIVDGIEYYIIEGKAKPEGPKYKVWIEKNTYLIRKISKNDSDGFTLYKTIILNKKIPENKFYFTVPKS